MSTNATTSQNHSWNSDLPINKLPLGRAEYALLSRYETDIRRRSRQLHSMNMNKLGRLFIYSRTLMEYAAIILYLRFLSYRILSTEVELRTGIKISKSQLQERIMNLAIDIGSFLRDKIIEVAIDATGLRPTEKGLWRVIIHEGGKIRIKSGFIKLFIANDVLTNHSICLYRRCKQQA